jgi:type IX secretion system PorP/SprF family membrane protein
MGCESVAACIKYVQYNGCTVRCTKSKTRKNYMISMNRFGAIFALLTCFSSTITQAQQIPLFTQYREMHGVLNPAAVPYSFLTNQNKASFGLLSRRQWLNMPNPPTTQILRGEYFAADRTGVAFLGGGYLIKDETGPTGFTGLYGRIAGVLTNDAEVGGVSVGLSIGMVQYRLKATELKLRDEGDIRATEDRTKLYPDLSIGAFWYQKTGDLSDDYVYTGVSVPQMMGLDLGIVDVDRTLHYERVRHYYASAGWYHFFGEGSFIEPSVWVKYVKNVPLSVDFNVRYQAANTFWVGAGASISRNIHAELGVILGKNIGFDSNFRVGYGFDYSAQTYGSFVGSTHELNISYSF